MKNTYKLIWSDEALNNLKEIIAYLEQQWTEKEIRKFSLLLDRKLTLISKNPRLFAKSDKSGKIRKAVLSRQTTIYYRISSYEVHIITLFDNRQNPGKIKHK